MAQWDDIMLQREKKATAGVKVAPPVARHTFPEWFLDRLKGTRYWSEDEGSPLLGGIAFIDHAGTSYSVFAGEPREVIFVSEPYEVGDLWGLVSFCEILNLDCAVVGESYWNPGATIRIEFYPKSQG